jgi:virginiamycin A acetyltransferase
VRSQLATLYSIARARRQGARLSLHSTSIDRRSEFGRGVFVAHHTSVRHSTVGRWTSVGRFSKIAFADIGNFCSVSWDVTIGAIQHPMDHASTHAFPYSQAVGLYPDASAGSVHHSRVSIGHDVWIGSQAIVLPGVTVADGAVVAAGAVVTKDVAPYTVAAGVPARAINERLPEDIAVPLRESSWWALPDETLRAHAGLFQRPVDADVIAELARLRDETLGASG